MVAGVVAARAYMSFILSGPDENIARAIEYARGGGSVVVAAAGNEGTADVTFPASYPGVVSVAASDADDATTTGRASAAGSASPRRAAT